MAKTRVSDDTILAQIPAAKRRAERSRRSQPHAAEARYERAGRRLHLTLTNGAVIVLPVSLIPSLRAKADRDLAEVTVGPAGVGLRWERLDEDLSVSGLLRFVVGSRMLLRASGAAGGGARSLAKIRAARLNGAKGGRPRGS